jgi:hypothetical protein
LRGIAQTIKPTVGAGISLAAVNLNARNTGSSKSTYANDLPGLGDTYMIHGGPVGAFYNSSVRTDNIKTGELDRNVTMFGIHIGGESNLSYSRSKTFFNYSK